MSPSIYIYTKLYGLQNTFICVTLINPHSDSVMWIRHNQRNRVRKSRRLAPGCPVMNSRPKYTSLDFSTTPWGVFRKAIYIAVGNLG